MRQFSSEHLAALGVLAVAIALSLSAATWTPAQRVLVSRMLAVVVLAAWVGEQVANVVLGTWSAKYNLPLQLTDAVAISTVLALWTYRAPFVELTYFWALTASLQATLTPDLAQSFPSVFSFTYFAYHEGAIVAACLLVFGLGLYPRPGAVWRVYGATLAVAAIAGIADVITGGNYMYLRQKPAHSSLLNVLGPWPWYIVSTAALGLGMLLALQALTVLVRRRPAAT